MKSSFLVSLVLSFFVVAGAFAQTATPTVKTEKGSFDKFYERLKISYFAAYQSSSITHWDNKALDEEGQKFPSYAHNIFNQISFNYNFGAKLNFVFNPRWTVNTGSTKDHGELDKTLVVLEDPLVGFQGVLYTNETKQFAWWTRIAARMPVSRASRNRDITMQPDWMNILTWDFNPIWQFGTYVGFRQWVYEDRFTDDRYRVYVAPYIQYAVNDTTKLSLWYENYSQQNLKSPGATDPGFHNLWEVTFVAISKDITPKVNFMPFIAYHLNNPKGAHAPLDNTGVGFWFSYQIK